MQDHVIKLVSVENLLRDNDALPVSFFIPNYQRGYRWEPEQVEQLLNDILQFAQGRQSSARRDEFYCLQPLVVRPDESKTFEVVDGQQRLTTILMILNQLNERVVEKHRFPVFAIDYESRPGLRPFMQRPTAADAELNPDYHFVFQAIQTIEKWLLGHGSIINIFEDALRHHTKFIWYQIDDSDNPVDAFARLNIGKIPLTNDELIRALILRQPDVATPDAKRTQLRMAHQWDEIERSLQRNDFWGFLSNDTSKSTNRIGLIFELLTDDGAAGQLGPSEYQTFFKVEALLRRSNGDTRAVWGMATDHIQLLENWFEDRDLFHIIGYLVHQGITLAHLVLLAKDSTKRDFSIALRRLVGATMGIAYQPRHDASEALRELTSNISYERQKDRKSIRAILLLYNITTLLEHPKSNIRFQFDAFKAGAWNLEHIRSVTRHEPNRHYQRAAWLQECVLHLEESGAAVSLVDDVKHFCGLAEADARTVNFSALYIRVLEQFGEADVSDSDDSIANITLLDEQTNKSYKNAPFRVKRQRILALDRQGVFTPLCTRNVFLKANSSNTQNLLFWSQADRVGYLADIVESIARFLQRN